MLSLVSHRKSCTVVAAAAVAADAGDVRDVSVVDDLQVRLGREVVEVRHEFLTSWKHLARVGAEAPWRLVVVDVGDERVPVVTHVELNVRLARVTLVDADERVVARILLKEAACPCMHACRKSLPAPVAVPENSLRVTC